MPEQLNGSLSPEDATTTPRLTNITCGSCGHPISYDVRFTPWCSDCGWNVAPERPEPSAGWRARSAQRARQRTDAIFATTQSSDRWWTSARPVRVGVLVTAAIVHAVTVAVGAFAVFLLFVWGGPLLFRLILGVLALGVTWEIQPVHSWRRASRAVAVDRGRAPALFAVLDRSAELLKTPPVERVEFSALVGASIRRTNGATTLHIGLGLWMPLERQARLALLGHELGHLANNDIRRHRWVRSALVSLRRWQLILTPAPSARQHETYRAVLHRRGGLNGFIVLVEKYLVPIALFPFVALIAIAGSTLSRLSVRDGQRAEYYADLLAAELAGNEGAVSLFDSLLVAPSYQAEVDGLLRFVPASQVWPDLAVYARSIPPMEVERRARSLEMSIRDLTADHPPTDLRRRLVATRNDLSHGQLQLEATVNDQIDKELAPVAQSLAASLSSYRPPTTRR